MSSLQEIKAMIWNSIVYKPASESEVGRISVAVSDDASAVRRMGQVGIDSFKFPKSVRLVLGFSTFAVEVPLSNAKRKRHSKE